LENSTLTNYDPLRESFKVFDPHNTGHVDEQTLRLIMSRIGYGHITDEDMKIMLSVADADKDGRISFDDWVKMIRNEKQPDSGFNSVSSTMKNKSG